MSISAGGTTFRSRTVSGAEQPENYLADSTGADQVGEVVDAPGSNTLLGRLKAIATALVGIATSSKQDIGNASLAAGEPISKGAAVTPSDSIALTTTSRALYVGGGGDLTVRLAGDSTDTVLKAVPTGSFLPLKVTYVKATGTTATYITALA